MARSSSRQIKYLDGFMDEGCAPTPAEARLILAMFELYRQQEYQDNTDRIEVECSFRLGKCCYGMGLS